MSDTATKPTLLEEIRGKRGKLQEAWDALIDERSAQWEEFEAKEETEDEERKAFDTAELDFRTQCETFEADAGDLDGRITVLAAKEERTKRAQENSVEVSDHAKVTEPLVYREDNAHEFCYMKDLMARDQKVQEAMTGDYRAALDRLRRHGRQMEERMPERENQRKREAEKRIEQAETEARTSFGLMPRELVSPFERRVSPSRAPGQGGEFVPPLWEIDQFSPFLRAGRVVAPLANNMPLPPGTDVVKVPRVKEGSEVAPQLADNAGVASKDIETESIEAPIKTIAGQQDVALQVIEMSPNQIFGRMVQEDLTAAWNREVDREVIAGAGTNYSTLNAGTIKGLLPVGNWGASGQAHESSTAISGQVILQGLGCNRAFIAQERFNTEGVVHVLHPKRAEYLNNAYDVTAETGRRLLEPTNFPQFNASGQPVSPIPAEGLVARLPSGSPIYMSTNIPVTFNKAATALKSETYDVGLTFKGDDVWFFESDARMRVLSEVLSGTLTVRYQIYSYVGMLVRFKPSVQACGGTPFAKEPTLGGYKYGA